MELVERDPALQTLQQRLRATAETGHVVFVAGEAVVGKTSVLRALGATHANVWWGACDALQTPHPLAPLLDMARDADVHFAARMAGPRSALFEAVLAPTLPALEACLDSGLLLSDTTSFSFRHELERVAVEAALAPPVAQSLHAQVLRAVAADGRPMPAARLAHHAVLADDSAAVRRTASLAADEARKRGANREAARHLRNALQQPAVAGDDQRRRWLEAYAIDSTNVDSTSDAIAARQELDALYRSSGDVAGEAANLSRLALLHMYLLRNAEADAASRRAARITAAQCRARGGLWRRGVVAHAQPGLRRKHRMESQVD